MTAREYGMIADEIAEFSDRENARKRALAQREKETRRMVRESRARVRMDVRKSFGGYGNG